jgi:hypothetical protein
MACVLAVRTDAARKYIQFDENDIRSSNLSIRAPGSARACAGDRSL